MEDIIKSIKAYLYDRTASPLIGAFVMAWSIWNYRFFLTIFSGNDRSIEEIFRQIDTIFPSFPISVLGYSISINGDILHGLIIPGIITLSYIYIYPRLAKPVYEHSLRKQKELQDIKHKEEGSRLLSIEESRKIYRKLADLQAEHSQEIDFYNKQIASLTETINDLEKSQLKKSEAQNESNESEEISADSIPENLDQLLKNGVEEISKQEFQLSDLFPKEIWQSMSPKLKQAIGKTFKSRVDSGDFSGIKLSRKGKGNQQIYIKNTSGLSPSEEQALKCFIGLESGLGLTESDIQQELGEHIEVIRVILQELLERTFIGYAGEANDNQQLYELTPKGRKYLFDKHLLPSQK